MAEKALKFDSVAIMCPEPIINFGLELVPVEDTA